MGYTNGDAPNLEDFREDIRREKKASDISARHLDSFDYSDEWENRIKRTNISNQVIRPNLPFLVVLFQQCNMMTLPQDQYFRNSIRSLPQGKKMTSKAAPIT